MSQAKLSLDQPLSDQEKQQLIRQIEQEVAQHPHAEQLGDGTILRALLPIVLNVVEQFLQNRGKSSGQPAAKPA
ncbi:MAG: hypothetical protein JO112_18485 [Planctomycetes bacterium]|nr:hypothetical protein [Planctomycetota bacterium]